VTALSYDFEPYSPRSRHWIDFAEAGQLGQLAAEVERTRDAIARAAVDKEKKGQLTADQVRLMCRTWLAIAVNLAGADNRKTAGIPWAAKVAALRAEVERRRNTYPADVDKGRLAPADARARLERLEAVHYHYFNMGFAFDGTREALRAHVNALSDALEQQQEKDA
jgi:hypothetical protein